MSDTVFVITRNGRKVCTADGPETARYIVKRYPEATVAEFRLVPVDAGDNLIDGDDWQYPFHSHKNSDVAFCYVRGDKSEGLVHIDGALDAESLERLAAYLRRA